MGMYVLFALHGTKFVQLYIYVTTFAFRLCTCGAPSLCVVDCLVYFVCKVFMLCGMATCTLVVLLGATSVRRVCVSTFRVLTLPNPSKIPTDFMLGCITMMDRRACEHVIGSGGYCSDKQLEPRRNAHRIENDIYSRVSYWQDLLPGHMYVVFGRSA